MSSGSDREEELPIKTKSSSRPTVPSVAAAVRPDILQSPPAPLTTDDRLVITYTCNKCSTSYRTIETFNAHQCAVPEISPRLLHCEECNFSTQSSRLFVEHSDAHQKVNVAYKCKLCGYHGNTLRGMRQHGRQHMLKNENFCDADVETMELPSPSPRLSLPAIANPVAFTNDVDEELLRLKNEPYKKRRSRKHYQKSEYMQISPQRKENSLQLRAGSSSPHSTSTISCASPLQISTINVQQYHPDRSPDSSQSPTAPIGLPVVKREPTDIVVDSKPLRQSPKHKSMLPERSVTPVKAHVCSCNASFASISTFEAHKKLYCTHHKAQRNKPVIAVNH